LLPPVGWVLVHPEITPPSNFYQLRDTTDRLSDIQSLGVEIVYAVIKVCDITT
jgi:hypothetical protein